MKKILKTGITNIVGIGMIGATANMSNSLPEGTAKNITGIIPGLQSAALLGKNLKMIKSFGKIKPYKKISFK